MMLLSGERLQGAQTVNSNFVLRAHAARKSLQVLNCKRCCAVAKPVIDDFSSADAVGRIKSRTKLPFDFSPSLAQHSLANAAVFFWQRRAFHQSGHSERKYLLISNRPFALRGFNNQVAKQSRRSMLLLAMTDFERSLNATRLSKRIPGTANRSYRITTAIVHQCLAQSCYMNIDSSRIHKNILPPDKVKQLVTTENATWSFHEPA